MRFPSAIGLVLATLVFAGCPARPEPPRVSGELASERAPPTKPVRARADEATTAAQLVDRAVGTVEELVSSTSALSISNELLQEELAHLTAQVKEARLSFLEAIDAPEGPDGDRARRRALFDLRTVPLTLSIVLSELGLQALHDGLPDEASDRLGELVHRARQQWLSLDELLQSPPSS